LRVDKAVWVDDGGDVKVKLVDEGLDARVGAVLGQKLPGEVPECSALVHDVITDSM